MSRLIQNKFTREAKKKQAQLKKILEQENESISKYKNDLDKISTNILLDYQTNKPDLLSLKIKYSSENQAHINELKDFLWSFDNSDLINIIDQARFLNDYSKDVTNKNSDKSWISSDAGLKEINNIRERFEQLKVLSSNFVSNSHNDLYKLQQIITYAKKKINDAEFFKPVEKIDIGTNKNKAKNFKILLGLLIGLIAVCLIFLFIIIGIFKTSE
ncbi:hypothetical protein LNO75_03490 [Mycoplasma sp. T363T]|uniref:hypothetical protein n=1 Tax=Mycoplasma bradburyae TaxID=2963128 RepID=UPI00234260C5|nr:hypothetical protein [Mycoplasma bradburyae]MDC4163622.1 hypothetical protein [Mycoplasma bradburyae]MDC4182988.1 hypothetical protein [Mycoplasma bradburyae]